MTDLRKAAEDLLEGVEAAIKAGDWKVDGACDPDSAIVRLRQALAQSEQEQKTPLKVLNLTVFTENRLRNGRVYDVETLQAMTNRDILAIPDMGKKALKEVLEALDVYASDMSQERVDETAKREHEPRLCCQKYDTCTEPCTPRGRHLAKREWVGLTDEEIDDWFFQRLKQAGDGWALDDVVRAVEAKLKEKNA